MTDELYPYDEKASNAAIRTYQQKTGSILFTVIIIRPDIVFTASQLARFNTNPSNIHHKTADRTIQYLYSMKEKVLRYEGDDNEACSFIYASDASFADNTLDRKSSQGYIMLLFGGAIAWKINK